MWDKLKKKAYISSSDQGQTPLNNSKPREVARINMVQRMLYALYTDLCIVNICHSLLF